MNNSPSKVIDLATRITMDETKPIAFRKGSPEDSHSVFLVFEESVADLDRRNGSTATFSIDDPEALASMWEKRRSLYEHLAHTAEQFWLAERGGRVVGFSRSILRDGVRELTELFVLPGEQSSGLGRQLLARAFPPGETGRRSIIASPDVRAQALYLKLGLHLRFPIYYFWKQPEKVLPDSDLIFEPAQPSSAMLAHLSEIDEVILGHRREIDHRWLLSDRQGFLYYREGQVVGYGYVGASNGPFALLESADYPAVLSHAENQAALADRHRFGLEIPIVNQSAVSHMVSRASRIDSFVATYMSEEIEGNFENYIFTSPPFIL